MTDQDRPEHKPCCTPGPRITPHAPEAPPTKHLLLVVSSDVLGKEEAIGQVLVKGFFETMKAYKQLPHTIFFLNAGVRLTTTNTDTVPVLKEIEALGVELYSCGTCLKHYGLEASLQAGKRGTTNLLVEGLQDFAKIVWI